MKVFGRGGLFNVTQRQQQSGQNNVHVIEGEIEVKRNGEQNVDIYKFQIESYSQKQIDYRSQKFVHGAGIMFTGDLHAGVIKIKDADLISNNHFFNDNTKALMSATNGQNHQAQNNTYQGYGAAQQQNKPYQQQYNSAPPVQQAQNPYAGYGTQNFNQQPAQNQYVAPVQPAQNQYAAPVQPVPNQYAPPAQNQYAAPAQNETPAQNQYQPTQENLQQQNAQPINNAPAFASPNQQQQQQQQNTQPINYADLFNTNK